MIRAIFIVLCLASGFMVRSQIPITDTTKTIHSPRKAVLWSAVLPGAGQVYNKKAWKVPIIYGAGVATGYLLWFNQTRFVLFRDAVRWSSQNNNAPVTLQGYSYSRDQLTAGRNSYRRTRDFSILAVALVYALQLADANVDAHLFQWDMSDNLTWRILSGNSISITLALK